MSTSPLGDTFFDPEVWWVDLGRRADDSATISAPFWAAALRLITICDSFHESPLAGLYCYRYVQCSVAELEASADFLAGSIHGRQPIIDQFCYRQIPLNLKP